MENQCSMGFTGSVPQNNKLLKQKRILLRFSRLNGINITKLGSNVVENKHYGWFIQDTIIDYLDGLLYKCSIFLHLFLLYLLNELKE